MLLQLQGLYVRKGTALATIANYNLLIQQVQQQLSATNDPGMLAAVVLTGKLYWQVADAVLTHVVNHTNCVASR